MKLKELSYDQKKILDYYNFKDKLEKKFPENLVEEHSSRPLKDLLTDARLLITTLMQPQFYKV